MQIGSRGSEAARGSVENRRASHVPQPLHEAAEALGGGGRGQGTVGDAQRAAVGEAEGAARNHGDTVFADEPFGDGERRVRGVDAQEKIKGTVGGRNFGEVLGSEGGEGALHDGAHSGEVAKFFADVGGSASGGGIERADGGVLGNYGRTDQERVLDFSQRGFEVRRRDHPADAPAREAVGFRE